MGTIAEKLTIMKDGKEAECDVLFTFDCKETGKNYVGYTDHSFGTNGRKNIYVSSFDPVVGTGVLEDITSSQELEMIQEVLAQIDDESKI